MWSVDRPKNRDTDEADETVSPAGTRRVVEAGAQAPSREVATVVVVGPPGCCGCISKPVSSRPRRKS